MEGVSGEFTAVKSSGGLQEVVEGRKNKRLKMSVVADSGGSEDGQTKMSHITVERNRRKQMNEHLSVLRSLMPCFYVKRVIRSKHSSLASFGKLIQQLYFWHL